MTGPTCCTDPRHLVAATDWTTGSRVLLAGLAATLTDPGTSSVHRREDEAVRWEIVGAPAENDEGWDWELARRGRTHTLRVLRSERVPGDRGRSLVDQHLHDHQPPDVLTFAKGWDFERGRPSEDTMGFTHMRGTRGLWTDVARRLNLPHWLQPRP